MNAFDRLLLAMLFNEEFSSNWISETICEYTSNKTYNVGNRYYNVVISTDYENAITKAYLRDTFTKKNVSFIAELKTDFPEQMAFEFSLFDISSEFLATVLNQ